MSPARRLMEAAALAFSSSLTDKVHHLVVSEMASHVTSVSASVRSQVLQVGVHFYHIVASSIVQNAKNIALVSFSC